MMLRKLIYPALFFVITCGLAVTDAAAQQTVSDCTRAMPERVVKKRVFPRTTFALNKKKREAIEKVSFPNGDRLTITNSGCEYYYLEFRYETGRFRGSATNTKYWYRRAVELIDGTRRGIDAPIRMADASAALKKYVNTEARPIYGGEIDYGEGAIRNFIIFESVKKIGRGRVAVTLAFAIGPL